MAKQEETITMTVHWPAAASARLQEWSTARSTVSSLNSPDDDGFNRPWAKGPGPMVTLLVLGVSRHGTRMASHGATTATTSAARSTVGSRPGTRMANCGTTTATNMAAVPPSSGAGTRMAGRSMITLGSETGSMADCRPGTRAVSRGTTAPMRTASSMVVTESGARTVT